MKVTPGRTFLEWSRPVTTPMVTPATSATVFDAVFRMAPALFRMAPALFGSLQVADAVPLLMVFVAVSAARAAGDSKPTPRDSSTPAERLISLFFA